MIARARWILTSAVALALFAQVSRSEEIEFQSEGNGYSLTLPDGWVRIPQDVVEEMKATMFSTNGLYIDYDAAFQGAEAAGWFVYPYLIVQVIPYEKMGLKRQLYESEFAEMAKGLAGFDLAEEAKRNVQPEIGQMFSEASHSAAKLDVARRQLNWSVKMHVAGIGDVFGKIVGHFGRNAFVQVMYYSKADELPLLQEKFVASAESFHFDSDNKYDDSKSAAPSSAGPSGATFIGVVVVTIAIVASRRKRRKSKRMDG